jgi:hypothetical protein
MRWSKLIIVIGIVVVTGAASFYFLAGNFSNQAEKRKVVNSIKFSLSLEEQAIQKSPFDSVEELERFFRQGFGDRLAAELANYNWPHGPDEVIEVPNNVIVLSVGNDQADAFYENPASNMNEDGSNRYVLLNLSKEDDRWVIEEATVSALKPSS